MMEITDIRIESVPESQEPLCAYVTIILDNFFLIRDLKIINGPKGLFVAMPTRRTMERCPQCQHRNPFGARFCNACGEELVQRQLLPSERVFIDVAHPISSDGRQYMHQKIISAYKANASKGLPAIQRSLGHRE